ncbi:hypothetical protein GXW74_07380 [Roseomonas eburnea]|uniref:DUF4384 domain-containing protein n=1 Tax=Neoroseomonas eburnea TaxID=1346889 RepID=A0A9X9X9B7_9PROT|nr:hypothetical protein [Neoroseomonas eburnea]MBR0680303.1 hypothetical protein [Neoroseomonas eburnea]
MTHTSSRRAPLVMFAAAAALLAGPALAQRPPGMPQRAVPVQLGVSAGEASPGRDLSEAAVLPPLPVGAAVSLRLSRGESAYFRLPDGAGELVAQTRRLARDTDTVMTLLDAQGRTLAEDDDGGEENLASRIEIGADQGGPLFLRVRLLEQGAGRFELVLQPAPPRDPAGPPATLTEAAGRPELRVGEPVAIELRGRQEAYFRLPPGGQDLVLLTRGLARGTDTTLALLDANGREIVEDDDGGEEQLASRVEVPGGQRRPLYVRARTISGGGSFELVALPDTSPPAPPFPASLREAATAPALESGQPVALRLRRGQAAFFRLPEGDIAVLTRNLRRGSDTVLALLDEGGNEIAEDDDGGGDLASRIEVPASEVRPLYVRAGLLGDASGEFELVVEHDAPTGGTFPTSLHEAAAAAALQPGVVVPIRLRRGQSAFFLLPPGEHVVLTRALRDGTDTVLELLDAGGAMLAEDDDGGEEGLASRLVVPGSRKGDVFVRAGVLGDGAGAFEVILLPPGGR